MMKAIILTLSFCFFASYAAATDDLNQLAAENRAIVKEFMGELKGKLKAALKEGGPMNAIKVCNIDAPTIAAKQSVKHGMQVGRTSLKVRNRSNMPDAWENAVLESFEDRKSAGEDPKTMEHYEIVTQDGKQVFRYMKAIPTAEKPCLTCHGANLKPEVVAVIDQLYPDDQARGFKAGDIRGAFTISRSLESENPAPMINIPNARTPLPGILTGGQPTPAHFEQAREAGYKTIINLRTQNERGTWDEASKAAELGLRYISIPVAGRAGMTMENVKALRAALEDKSGYPVMLHCASGNRVGGLIALNAGLLEKKPVEEALKIGRSAGLRSLEPVVRQILEQSGN